MLAPNRVAVSRGVCALDPRPAGGRAAPCPAARGPVAQLPPPPASRRVLGRVPLAGRWRAARGGCTLLVLAPR